MSNKFYPFLFSFANLYNTYPPPSQVTGVRGLMARSVLHENSTVPGGVWHNSTAIPGWLWKGDTSSDEVVGHMFAYPLVHDLVARNEEERAVASGLVDDIVGECVCVQLSVVCTGACIYL